MALHMGALHLTFPFELEFRRVIFVVVRGKAANLGKKTLETRMAINNKLNKRMNMK